MFRFQARSYLVNSFCNAGGWGASTRKTILGNNDGGKDLDSTGMLTKLSGHKKTLLKHWGMKIEY